MGRLFQDAFFALLVTLLGTGTDLLSLGFGVDTVGTVLVRCLVALASTPVLLTVNYNKYSFIKKQCRVKKPTIHVIQNSLSLSPDKSTLVINYKQKKMGYIKNKKLSYKPVRERVRGCFFYL